MRSLCWRLNVFLSGTVFCLVPIYCCLLKSLVYELRALVFEGHKAMLLVLKNRINYIFMNNSLSKRCAKLVYIKTVIFPVHCPHLLGLAILGFIHFVRKDN